MRFKLDENIGTRGQDLIMAMPIFREQAGEDAGAPRHYLLNRPARTPTLPGTTPPTALTA